MSLISYNTILGFLLATDINKQTNNTHAPHPSHYSTHQDCDVTPYVQWEWSITIHKKIVRSDKLCEIAGMLAHNLNDV